LTLDSKENLEERLRTQRRRRTTRRKRKELFLVVVLISGMKDKEEPGQMGRQERTSRGIIVPVLENQTPNCSSFSLIGFLLLQTHHGL